MEPLDYTALQELYGGKHVAFRNDQVVAYADTFGEVIRMLKEKDQNLEDVVFEFIHPKGICVYCNLQPKVVAGIRLP